MRSGNQSGNQQNSGHAAFAFTQQHQAKEDDNHGQEACNDIHEPGRITRIGATVGTSAAFGSCLQILIGIDCCHTWRGRLAFPENDGGTGGQAVCRGKMHADITIGPPLEKKRTILPGRAGLDGLSPVLAMQRHVQRP